VMLDDDPKMQFVISFNERDENGRYRGARKLALDMPRSDATFLRQRLALYGLRSIGVPAQCANSARLFVNDEFYGLYANVERMDRELLERLFPEDPDGDLWEGGRFIKTNEDEFTWERLDAFWELPVSGTVEDLSALADLEASIRVWAAEAVLPHADGYYMGRPNFYLYDHPSRGFVWLPNDLDSAFDFVIPDIDAMFPYCAGQTAHDREHYLMVMDDPAWRERYVDALAEALAAYDVADMEERLDQWAGQIDEAAAADPRAPFSHDAHQAAVANMRDYFRQRAAFLDDWLMCREGGGADGDGDGTEFCRDCDDSTAELGPHMPETCNAIDDDCDGHVDEAADCSTES
jgi:spore coat protein CotH